MANGYLDRFQQGIRSPNDIQEFLVFSQFLRRQFGWSVWMNSPISWCTKLASRILHHPESGGFCSVYASNAVIPIQFNKMPFC